jgi:N utilization substance protein A
MGQMGITLNLGRTEALLPKKEQVPGERYQLHQRLRAYVVEVKKSTRGPQIVVSRSHKNMLRRLLELEVPEIYNGTVEIKSIAREAGARSKIAVAAIQPGIDPVGACVGMRGVRIQSIVSELGGEKIDVIEWNADPALYIQKALSPARVLTVHPEDDAKDGKMALVVVPDDQLSLAIGREGQNARLAAKLTNWRIDIKGSSEAARETLLHVEADPEIKEKLAGTTALVQAALQRHAEQPLPWNTDEMQQIKLLVDGQRHFVTARKRAEREKTRAAQSAMEAPSITAEPLPSETARQEAINAYRARIPVAAYAMPVGELGLNPRVLEHIERSGLTNVGQIHERLATGDEAMLAIDGIGPKGLAHIKQVIDEKGLGLKPVSIEAAPAVSEPAPVEQPIEPVVAPEPIVAEEKPAEVVVVVQPPVEEQPVVAAAAEQPAPEGEAAVAQPAGPIDIEEIEDEEELERKGGKKKGKRKDRTLVFDEEHGVVIAKKQRKAGRGKDLIDLGEEDL